MQYLKPRYERRRKLRHRGLMIRQQSIDAVKSVVFHLKLQAIPPAAPALLLARHNCAMI
jgi:hypothetical protein